MEYGNIGRVGIQQASKFHNNAGGISGMKKAFRHNERIATVEAVYPDLTPYNHDLIDLSSYYEKYGDDTLKTIVEERKNGMSHYTTDKTKAGGKYKLVPKAVTMFEVVLTYIRPYNDNVPGICPLDYDPEERKRWEDESIAWAREQFRDPVSGRDNVVAASVHYDEASPHIHLMIVPEYNGRFNQKQYIGSRDRIKRLAKSYNKMMHDEFGLRLMRENSHSINIPVREERSREERAIHNTEIMYEISGETPEQAIGRANEAVKNVIGEKSGILYRKDREIESLRQQILQPDIGLENKIEELNVERESLENRYFDESMKIKADLKALDDIKRTLEERDGEEAREAALLELRKNEELMQEIIQRQHQIEHEENKRKRKRRKKYQITRSLT